MKRISLALVLTLAATAVLFGQSASRLLGVTPADTTPAPTAAVTPTPADPFFDDTVLQQISFTINSRDWQSLKDHYLDNTYYPIDFKWGNQVVRNSGIRSRGTGSRSGVKPGLRVDFDRYVMGQTFLGLKSFVLRNNTQDASGMHERISMQLARRMGLLAPREAHTKMFVNNQYVGLYTIVESIDKTYMKQNVGEDGGYIIKYDYPPDAPPYYFDDKGTDPASYVPLPFKPETNETDPQPEHIVSLVQTINHASDATFRTAIAPYLGDLTKIIRHVAVERYVAEQDGFLSDYGGMNNYYAYRFNNQDRWSFIFWDKSEAFKGGPGYPVLHNIADVPATFRNRLLSRILAFRDLYSYYLDTLIEASNSASEKLPAPSTDQRGWMEREIEREYAQIRDAEYADPEKPWTNDQFEQDVQALRVFAQTRPAFITSDVAAARTVVP